MVNESNLCMWLRRSVGETRGNSTDYVRNGRDAKLKAKALNVIRGKANADTIPAIAKALRNKLGFLKTRLELIPAFK